MLIRRMNDHDVEPVVELALANHDGVMAEHHSAEILAGLRADVTPQFFRDQMAWKQVFVAEEAGEVVATGALADFGSPGAPKYTVSQFYVRSDVHGRGIGTRLLAHIGEAANSTGADRLHVPSSRNAIGFYERAGFTVDSGQPDAAIEITWMTMSIRDPKEQARRADRP
jgi:GNAT superfamily N-acetyltransferase